MSRRTVLRVALAAPFVLTACGGPPADAPLTDPAEIVARTITATTGLRTAHLRLEVDVRPSETGGLFGIPGLDFGGGPTLAPGEDPLDPLEPLDPDFATPEPQPVSALLEADVDVPNEAFAVSLTVDQAEAGEMALIVVDGTAFVQDAMQGGWTEMPMDPMAAMGMGLGGAMVPAEPGAVLDGLLAHAGTSLEHRGVVECATGRCYGVRATVSVEALAAAYVQLLGLEGMVPADMLVPPDLGLPPLPFDLYTDTATHRLVEADLQAAIADGTSFRFRLLLSRHDEPVAIERPAGARPMPDIDAILSNVGSEVGEGVAP